METNHYDHLNYKSGGKRVSSKWDYTALLHSFRVNQLQKAYFTTLILFFIIWEYGDVLLKTVNVSLNCVIKIPFGRVIYNTFFFIVKLWFGFLFNILASMESVSYFLSVTHLIKKLRRSTQKYFVSQNHSFTHCFLTRDSFNFTYKCKKNFLLVRI